MLKTALSQENVFFFLIKGQKWQKRIHIKTDFLISPLKLFSFLLP